MDDKSGSTAGTPAIACDMTEAPDTPQERMAEYHRLFERHLVSRERTANGIRFRLRADDGVEAWVRDLLAREKACCPFFDFDLAVDDGVLRWDISVVDDDLARAVLDEFYRVTATSGEDWTGVQRRLTDIGFAVATGDMGVGARPGVAFWNGWAEPAPGIPGGLLPGGCWPLWDCSRWAGLRVARSSTTIASLAPSPSGRRIWSATTSPGSGRQARTSSCTPERILARSNPIHTSAGCSPPKSGPWRRCGLEPYVTGGGGGGPPFDQDRGGVVLKILVLMGQDRVYQPAQSLRRGNLVGQRSGDELDQAVAAEELTGVGAGLDDAVGVEQDLIARLQGFLFHPRHGVTKVA